MRKIYSLLFVLLAMSSSFVYAQSMANYAGANFAASAGTFTPLSGAISVASVSAGDDVASAALPIGFTFYYMGKAYTQFRAGSDGYISLYTAGASSSVTNNLATGATVERPVIAPYWDDMDGSASGGSASYLTSGSVGSRVLTFQWLNWARTLGANPILSFQVKLYESTGVIQFIYRSDATAMSGASASIGLSAVATGSGNYVSLNGAGASPTTSTTSETTTISAKPATGQTYTFTPPQAAVAAPSAGITFTGVSTSGMTLNWTDGSTNETGFNIFRSTDNVTFTWIGTTTSTTVAGTSTVYTFPQTGLTISTLYYYRVVANSEGVPSTAVTGNNSTNGPTTYTWNVASGSWATPASWTPNRNVPDPTDALQFNNPLVGATQTATNVPAETIKRLTVGGGVTAVLQAAGANTLNIPTDGTGTDELSVANGSTLLINGTNALTITFTTGATANIAGTLELNNTTGVNALTLTNCVMTVPTGGKLAAGGTVTTSPWNSSTSSLLITGTYEHKYTTAAGTIPTATWNTNSKLLISGYTTAGAGSPSGFTQTFYDVEWNCTSQTAAINCTGSIPVVTGTFTMTSTASFSLRLATTTAYSTTWANYAQTGGTLDLSSGASASAQSISITNSFNQTGGTFLSTGTGTTAPVLNFSKSTAGAESVNFFNAAPAGPIVYRVSATSGINLTGTGTLLTAFNINSGGGVRISTLASPAITTSLTLTYAATGTTLTYDYATGVYDYVSSATEFPLLNGPANLTLNLPTGADIQLPFTRSLPSTGVLTLTAGILYVTTPNTFTIGNSAVGGISGGSSTAYVRGALVRTFAASLAGGSTYNFPIGTATTYSLIQALPTTTAGGTSTVQFETFDGATGGSPDLSTIVVLNNDKYWKGTIVSGANFTSTILKLTDATYGASARMARSATQSGTYAGISPAPVSNVLTSSSITSLNYITVGQFGTAISGIKTVCASGCDYASLTLAAGAFASINSGIVTGNVTLQIAGNLTGETGANLLNEFASPYTVTIKPTGVARTITGSSANGLITLNAADRVTIDGSLGSTANTVCPVSAASQDLTITNTNTGTSSAVIWLQSVSSNGATSNTIKNCIITGSGNTQTLFGLGSGSSTISTTSAGTGNNNNSFVNNSISKTQFGIYSGGASAASKNSGNVINQNLINTVSPNNVATGGILVGFENNITISGNNISEINGSSDRFAISAGYATSFSGTSTTFSEVTNATITNNIIGNVIGTGTNTSFGIALNAASSGTSLIANNMIYGVAHNATSPDISAGIAVGGGTSTTNVFHNTVSMQGTITGGTAGGQTTACLAVTATSAPTLVDVRNNIFSNTQANNSGTTMRFAAIALGYSSTLGNYAGLTGNNNDLYAAGSLGTYTVGITGGMAGTNRTTLAAWTTETGKDGASKNVAPVFLGTTNLHLNNTNATNTSNLDGTGVSGTGVSSDIDCDTRNVSIPDIGADEFAAPNCTGATGGTAFGNAAFCGSGTPTITATGYSTGNTTTYQWYSSTTIGDYPNAGSPVSLQTNPSALTTGVVSTITYYWLRVTCGANSAVDNSTMVTITINPVPAAVTGSGAGTFCTSTSISATGGAGGTIYFQGTTSGGTSTILGSTPQTVTSSGTYYFRSGAAGCFGTEGSVAVIIQTPAGITGTPASICAGASGSIAASAANCTAFVASGTTISGAWVAASDPIALRPTSSISNSTTCSFDAAITRNYVAQQFQVTTTGNYVFEMNNNGAYDGMGYIVFGGFAPGNCAGGGTWVRGDDDNGSGASEPKLGGDGTMLLTSGITYTLISTTYSISTGTTSGSFAWTITPPSGGQVMLPGAGVIEWYTAASGGTAIGTGSPFNPVGVLNSGLPNTNTPGTTTYYAACSGSPVCRTAVNFVINPNYTITASSGANGSISPNGVTTLTCLGTGSQTYTITPNTCYSVANVLVDGVSVGAVGSYTFSNVTANHTISASFVLSTFAITVTSGANGSVTPATGNINCGDNATYTITPNACYSIADVVVDGVSQGAVGTYTFTNVTAAHTISATFVQNTFAITVTSGANGSVTPATGNVNCGANATYTITPNACYSIADVVVDGVSQGAVGTYTFTNVTAAHAISATFVQNTFAITVTSGANGSVTPATGNVNCGDNATYTITPNACYSIADVVVDGVSQGTVGTYTFTNVTAAHTISATFVQNTFAITVTQGANGTIAPGTGNVNCGSNATYTITPNGGYSVLDVVVDGSSVGAVTSYTFTNVQAAHTITASFIINCINVSITSASASPVGPLCSGQTTTLSANGVAGTNAVVTWYTGPNGTGANLGTGLTLPNQGANTYYARVTGDCGTPVEASVTVGSIGNTFTGTGNWTEAARWSCGAQPSSGDIVTIAAGAVCTLNTNFLVSGSLTMTATSTLIVNPTRTLSIDVAATANFAGQSVTFLSDATGTASLGQIAGTLSGATNVTVERFIPNNGFRSWRLLSVPTQSSRTIRQSWQEGDLNPLPKDNNVANRGTQITGVFTTQAAAAAAGFDSTSVQAGMLRWNGASWTNVVSTNQPINNFNSWFLYIRGERSLTVTGAVTNSSATTLRTKGTVYTGDQTISVGANAFELIPNLYPSAINFTGLTRTGGVNNLFYIWDSKKQSGTSLGTYQTFSGTNSFNCILSGGSYTFGQPNTTIESGQSFFVTSSTAGTVVLKESAKISGTNGSLGFRPSAVKTKMDTRLYNANDEMLDANTVVFDRAYDKAVAEEDAPKFGNPGANFAIENSSKLLAIEGTEPVKEGDAIQFRMWNLAQGAYSIELAASNFSLADGVTATLEDSYLKTSTAISLTEATKVKFEINSNAGSSAANRFKVVFAKAKPVIVDSKQTFTIAPNPIETGVMNVQFKNQLAGKYSIRLVATGGQSMMVKAVSHAGGNATQNVVLPSGLASGTYTVEIVAPDKTRTTQTVVVNRK